MTELQAERVLRCASLIRELRAAREELVGQLDTFDDYTRRGGTGLLRFSMHVLSTTGEFWIKDAKVAGEMQRAGRQALVERINDVARRLAYLEMPKE